MKQVTSLEKELGRLRQELLQEKDAHSQALQQSQDNQAQAQAGQEEAKSLLREVISCLSILSGQAHSKKVLDSF